MTTTSKNLLKQALSSTPKDKIIQNPNPKNPNPVYQTPTLTVKPNPIQKRPGMARQIGSRLFPGFFERETQQRANKYQERLNKRIKLDYFKNPKGPYPFKTQ